MLDKNLETLDEALVEIDNKELRKNLLLAKSHYASLAKQVEEFTQFQRGLEKILGTGWNSSLHDLLYHATVAAEALTAKERKEQ